MATSKKMDLLTAVEQIVEKAKESQLGKEFYRKADRYIKYVSEKMELTKEQSVIMALFINRSDDNHILIRDISGDINCPTIRILRYLKDIDELEKKESAEETGKTREERLIGLIEKGKKSRCTSADAHLFIICCYCPRGISTTSAILTSVCSIWPDISSTMRLVISSLFSLSRLS